MRRLFVVTVAVGLLSFGAARAEDKCKIAVKGDSPIAVACKKGGQQAAAKQMKALVKAAKVHGTVFKCDHCHEDMTSYKLTDDAKKDFPKLLEAAGYTK